MAKSAHQTRVERFMYLADQPAPDKPVIPGLETRRLRAKLILEEAVETVRGLGFMAMYQLGDDDVGPNLVEIADGCWDVIVVTTGTLSACGIDDLEGQIEVDSNNLAKFGPGHKLREDGKLIKPPNHQPPNIEKILADQGYKHETK